MIGKVMKRDHWDLIFAGLLKTFIVKQIVVLVKTIVGKRDCF